LSSTFEIEPVAPFRLDLTVWALRRRAGNAVDRWDGRSYRRALVVDEVAVDVEVTQTGSLLAPRLEVVATGGGPSVEAEVKRSLARLLGVHIDLAPFFRSAASESPLSDLVDRFMGVKPPRFATLFEGLANAVACQQLSLEVGVRLLNSLALSYGMAVGEPPEVAYTFPDAEALAGTDPSVLRALGFSWQKAVALIGLAESVECGDLRIGSLEQMDNSAAGVVLQRERGIGRWSAEYVLLRTLGRLDMFPGDDVGARNKLQRWLGLDTPPGYDEIRSALARWEPFAGLVYFHLLLDGLSESGSLNG